MPKGPFRRLIPQAAHRRSLNVCGDRASSLNSRTVRRARSASANEPSRSRFGSMSLIASSPTLPVLRSPLSCMFVSNGNARSRGRIPDRLRERDELPLGKVHRRAEPRLVGRAAKDGREPLRGAEEIDVLPDETGVSRGEQPPLLWADVGHAFAVRDIDEIERRDADEILCSAEGAKIVLRMRNERMGLRI